MTVEMADTSWQCGLGLATMENRDLVTHLNKPPHSVWPDEVSSAENKYPHILFCFLTTECGRAGLSLTVAFSGGAPTAPPGAVRCNATRC